jgi:hypothetical protein
MQASWLGLGVLATAHRKSGPGSAWRRGGNEMVSRHAWTICVVDEEAHVQRAVEKHSSKNDATMHLLTVR